MDYLKRMKENQSNQISASPIKIKKKCNNHNHSQSSIQSLSEHSHIVSKFTNIKAKAIDSIKWDNYKEER